MNAKIGRQYVPYKHLGFWDKAVKQHSTRYAYVMLLLAKGFVI